LCEAIIVMAHKLGLQVIAECVEEQLQAEMLDKAGCDFVQGYLYSRPILAEQLDAILRHGAMGR
jgi:EAL domain-containing protein (putative c-di-GMP-specific phosphodiesterase class I)